jgi:threonine dehydrogenase-like Zn-dependent dehydrogenase
MMKAAVLRGPQDIRLETVETPSIREDEVLVRVMACYAATRARIQTGQTIAVIGAGMIGQCIAQVSRHMGARTIISELSPLRLATARRLGADIVLNPRETDPIEAVAAATSGDMADAVFECSGSPGGFRQAAQMVRPFGTMVQVGLFENTLEIPGELAGSGQVKTGDLVTQRFPLDRIQEAFESQMDPGSSIKGLITP